MKVLVGALLTLFVLSCADYGRLVLKRDGAYLSLPDGPQTEIFEKTRNDNWRSLRDDEIFEHLGGPFFKKALHPDAPHLVVCLNRLDTDYTIHGAYDLDLNATACANSQGITLKEFGANMLFHERQYRDLSCVLHTLNNVFQERFATSDYLEELSVKRYEGTTEPIYSALKRRLDQRKARPKVHKPEGVPFEAWIASVNSKGFTSANFA
eukprot:3867_1